MTPPPKRPSCLDRIGVVVFGVVIVVHGATWEITTSLNHI